jgi:glucose/arabinose dehydrogenase
MGRRAFDERRQRYGAESMRRVAIGCLIAVLVGLGASVPGFEAAAATPSLRLTRVTDLANVTAISARTGTRTLYVTEQSGVVRSIRGGALSSTPVVDLTDRVSQEGGELGLLGIVFSPDGTRMYVDYTDRDHNTQIDQFVMRGRNADASSRRTILTVDQPQANHKGGQLAFGPDGDLYIGLGDGGSEGDVGAGHAPGGNGQSLGTRLGKILRISPSPDAGDPAYTVPADNPFVGRAGVEPEIWAYGLRNPWRFSFDRANGDLWIGDVGQDKWEEIDHVAATNGRGAGKGDNFGWNRLEGTHPYEGTAPAGAVAPVHEISHDTGACAVTGGFVYRGKKLSSLVGDYVFSDTCDSTIRVLEPNGEGGVTMGDTGAQSKSVSTFGQANDGTLYVASLSDGIFRVDAA